VCVGGVRYARMCVWSCERCGMRKWANWRAHSSYKNVPRALIEGMSDMLEWTTLLKIIDVFKLFPQ